MRHCPSDAYRRAFGGRALYDVGREALMLARHVRQPVKVQWTREEKFRADRVRPPSSHRVRIRADKAGHISDWWQASVSGHFLLTEIMTPKWALGLARMVMADFGATRKAAARPTLHHAAGSNSRTRTCRSSLASGDLWAQRRTRQPSKSQWTGWRRQPASTRSPCAFSNLGPGEERLGTCLKRLRKMMETSPLQPDAARGIACGIYHDHSHVAAAFDVSRSDDGSIRVQRAFCVLDIGLVVNPDRVRAQTEGCLMMAIGQVLMEQAHLSDGLMTARSFPDYETPTHRHVPEMRIELIEHATEPPAGAGEAPLIAAVPALANAVSRLKRENVDRLPVTGRMQARPSGRTANHA
ncbi:MAG: molybdopterin-dependent oxidoreductase [Breoghania sp.]|nr:molybdopterin-dependent oxidoreductase [Breoghania sp.]